MKILAAAAVAMTIVALAGCAGASPDASPPSSPAPAETVQESPAPTASPSPTPTESPSKYGVIKRNARGNLVKAVGQLAGMSGSADGPITVEFKITAIDPNFVCTSENAEKPANGRFVALTLEVTTTPELAQADYPEVAFNPYDFKVISPEGTRENDSVGNGFSCLKESDALPATIGPGEHVVGKIVLDTAQASGSIVYVPSDGDSGYEWAF